MAKSLSEMLAKSRKVHFISVVYFNMEKVLLYWSMDQYNNVQTYRACRNLWIGKEVARWQEKTNIWLTQRLLQE